MDKVNLDVYIFFTDGQCKEAMGYYKSVFGGELSLSTYGEAPQGEADSADHEKFDEVKQRDDYSMAEMSDKIMHSNLKGGVIDLMGSDSTRKEPFGESFISLSLGGREEAKLREVFDKLSSDGKVTMPLAKQFWGDTFGTLTDKYGVDWMVNISIAK